MRAKHRRSIRIPLVTVTIVAFVIAFRGMGLGLEIVEGSAPSCPTHDGVRQFRSAQVRAPDVTAYMLGTASRRGPNCRKTVKLRVTRTVESGVFWRAITSDAILADDHGDDDFAIVDFSPEGKSIFLYRNNVGEYPNEELRDVEISAVPIASSRVQWQNLWDLMHWKDCDATIDLLGVTAEGGLAISARPSVMSPARRSNCVSDATASAINLQSRAVTELPKAAKMSRYSKIQGSQWETCKADPDLAGACFALHGRVSAANGSPTFRIWRSGTRRFLGVSNDILPETIATHMNWDAEAFADFLVCPLTPERPGRMQMVCVESARNVIFKKR